MNFSIKFYENSMRCMCNECLFYCLWMQIFVIYYFIYFLIFIHLVVSGLRCIMQDLPSQHADSPVVAHGLSRCDSWSQLPHSMWDLSSLTRDQTHVPCIARQIPNHWTPREVPVIYYFMHASQTVLFTSISLISICLQFLHPYGQPRCLL